MSRNVVNFPHSQSFAPGGGGRMDLTERLELYQRQNAERFGRIEEELREIRSEMKEELREIRSDLKKIPLWFVGTTLTVLTFLVGLIYFVHASNQQFMSILVSALKQ